MIKSGRSAARTSLARTWTVRSASPRVSILVARPPRLQPRQRSRSPRTGYTAWFDVSPLKRPAKPARVTGQHRPITLVPSLEAAWRDVGSSFERFYLTAGIGAVEQMLCEDRAGVNAFIQDVDRIGNSRLPAAVIMCTNRRGSLDPAVRRREADILTWTAMGLSLRADRTARFRYA